jgi:hypothetical protein
MLTQNVLTGADVIALSVTAIVMIAVIYYIWKD